MKVCIIGNGLVSLTLANVLAKKGLSVDILLSKKINNKINKTRTIGISKSNIDFYNKKIRKIDKIIWKIKNIKIYTEKSFNEEVLEFNNDDQIFSILKNYELLELLNKNLKKNKYVRFKNKISTHENFQQKYNLIINCDLTHEITKKFFSKKIKKKYNSFAYTTVINHKKVSENNVAFQNFTNDGPIAFLPISKTQTSVVYSLRNNHKNNFLNIKNLIKKYNPIYSIQKIENLSRFELIASNLRKYHQDNILAFGELLHQIHPLAGQGFNMSIRDIKLLSELIDEKLKLGLVIDASICSEFQKSSQSRNFLFSTGIDWIYELFNFESKLNSKILSRSINIIGNNKIINSFFKKFADNGLRI